MYTNDEERGIKVGSITSGLTAASQLIDSTGVLPSTQYGDNTAIDISVQQLFIPQVYPQQRDIDKIIEEAMNESNRENSSALRRLARL